MPLTPFHPVVPWLPYIRWPASFSFWAVTLGAMVSDLEVPIAFVLTGDLHHSRGIMHSFVGVFTLNAAVTLLAVRVLVPPLLRWYDRTWPRRPDALVFAGQDLRKDSRSLSTLYGSAVLGGLTHILVDVPTHSFNPLLWPWVSDPLNLVSWSNEPWYFVVTTVLWGVLFFVVFAAFWRR